MCGQPPAGDQCPKVGNDWGGGQIYTSCHTGPPLPPPTTRTSTTRSSTTWENLPWRTPSRRPSPGLEWRGQRFSHGKSNNSCFLTLPWESCLCDLSPISNVLTVDITASSNDHFTAKPAASVILWEKVTLRNTTTTTPPSTRVTTFMIQQSIFCFYFLR